MYKIKRISGNQVLYYLGYNRWTPTLADAKVYESTKIWLNVRTQSRLYPDDDVSMVYPDGKPIR